VQADRVVAAGNSERHADAGNDKADQDGELALVPGELGDHLAPACNVRKADGMHHRFRTVMTAAMIDSGDAVPTINPSRQLVPWR
jgi:hypothetical protein